MPSNDSVKFEGCYGDNDCYKGGDVIYLMNSSCHGIHVFVPSRAISKTLFTKLALLQLYCRGWFLKETTMKEWNSDDVFF